MGFRRTAANYATRDELRKKTVWSSADIELAREIGYEPLRDHRGPWGSWQPWLHFDGSQFTEAEARAAGAYHE